VTLDLALRHVGEVELVDLPAYTALDVRLGWHVSDALELALYGRDLGSHAEFRVPQFRSRFEPQVGLALTWRP
jgi:iron complex outermembrane receptor protein